MANLVHRLNKGRRQLLEISVGGVRGDGDVANLATGLGGLAVQVQEDVHLVIVGRVGEVDQGIVRLSLGTSQDVEHDGLGNARLQLE